MSNDVQRRLHPTWIVYSAINSLRAMIIPLGIVLISQRNFLEAFIIVFSLVIALVVTGYRAIIWSRFSFELSDRGIRVQSGLFSRQDRFLPVERIQSVNFNENLLHRMLRVVAVNVESAAGSGEGADIVLEAISRDDAIAIRERLLRSRPAIGSEPTMPSPMGSVTHQTGELIATVSIARLAIAGATAGRVGPLIGVVVVGFQFIDDLLPGTLWRRASDVAPNPTLELVTGLVIVGCLVAWAFSIVSTIVTYGGFELRLNEDRLHISYGLLEKRRVTIPLKRVQAVTITQGLLSQPFGFSAIRVESAGYGKDGSETGVLMPIIKSDEVESLLARTCPLYAIDARRLKLNHPPQRARRRYILAPVWTALAITVVGLIAAIAIPDIAWQWGTAGLLLIPLAVWFGASAYAAAGWVIDDSDRLVVTARPLHRATTITTLARVQMRWSSASLMQRRADLASFTATVPSGGSGGILTVSHLDRRVCDDLLSLTGSSNGAHRSVIT